MESILSKYLAAGLLPIGEDDEKLKLLEAAAAALALQIGQKPILAYRFALVGLDNRVPISDSAIKKAEEAVREKWITITNKLGASPVQVYRAVILRALQLAVAENSAMRQAIWLIAQNEPELHTNGAEREAIISMIDQFEEANNVELRERWANPISVTLPKLPVRPKKVSGKDELITGMARASGPTDKDGNALTNPNPHTPAEGQAWSNEFARRAADAIFAVVQHSAKGAVDDLQESLRGSMENLINSVERLAIREAKSELLWIRTSLYSPSARAGYRGLTEAQISLHAALDTSRAMSRVAPPSVDFFLRDLVSALSIKKVKLKDVLAEVGSQLVSTPEARLMEDSQPPQGRRSWLDIAVRPNKEFTFEEQTGVADAYEDSVPELAIRFYRELQIRKILSTAE